jgi:thioredoxin reductase (NADPH)
MLAVLEDLRGEYEFGIDVRDVDADPDWQERYGSLIPVLKLGGEEICHYFIDLAKVREVLGRFR